MSLPSSERLPNDINDLPPARQRHIRRQPRAASLAERGILLDSLIKLTAPTPSFFLRALLGALALGAAFYLQDPTVLIIAIVALPFQAPLFGLSLYPATLNFKHVLKSLVSLVILLALSFGAGALAGMFHDINPSDPLGLYRFSALYWLDVSLVAFSAFVSGMILLRQGKIPRGIGVLLSYALLVPIAVIGFGFTNSQTQLWSGALWVSFTHLGLAVVMGAFSFLIFGFPPKKALSWLWLIVALMITLAVASISMNISTSQNVNPQATMSSATLVMVLSVTPSPQSLPTLIPTLTRTSPPATATYTSSPSPESSPTLTPEPTTFWGVINADIGAVIRENPSFDADVITYTNNGDAVEILGMLISQEGARWYQVQTESGFTGWLLGSLVQTATPTPTEND